MASDCCQWNLLRLVEWWRKEVARKNWGMPSYARGIYSFGSNICTLAMLNPWQRRGGRQWTPVAYVQEWSLQQW